MTQAHRTLTFFLPLYATAIGSPASPAEYLRDVVTHNLAWARTQRDRGMARPERRMTHTQRREFSLSLDAAKAARSLLRSDLSAYTTPTEDR